MALDVNSGDMTKYCFRRGCCHVTRLFPADILPLLGNVAVYETSDEDINELPSNGLSGSILYYLVNGLVTRLIPADSLPLSHDFPLYESKVDGMYVLPSADLFFYSASTGHTATMQPWKVEISYGLLEEALFISMRGSARARKDR